MRGPSFYRSVGLGPLLPFPFSAVPSGGGSGSGLNFSEHMNLYLIITLYMQEGRYSYVGMFIHMYS